MSGRAERAAWWVIGFLFVGMLGMAVRPAAELPERPLTEDAFYALAVSRSLAAGLGATVDGVAPTNGFQPLFTVLSAVVYLPGLDRVATLRGVLLLHWLVLAAAAWTLGDVARRLVPAGRAASARAFSVLGYVGAACVYFQHFNGLETGLTLLGWLWVLRAWLLGEQETVAGAARLGLWVGLLVLARIDTAFLAVALGVAVLLGPGDAGDRWRRLLTVAGVAALVSSPWWLYNQLWFGNLLPTSGKAQQDWALSPMRLAAAADAAFMSLAPMTALPGSTAALETLPFKALRAGIGVGLVVTLWQAAKGPRLVPDGDVARRLGSFVGAGVAALAAILAYYVLGSYAVWHYPRYFAPLAIPSSLWLGIWLSGRSAVARFAALPLLPALLVVGLVDLYGPGNWRHSPFWTHQVTLVRAHVPPDVRVASWQSGTLGYFRDGVLNLDGKVNADALARKADMDAYLREQGIDWLVDWPANVAIGLGLEHDGDPATVGWKAMAEQGGFAVYRRASAAPSAEDQSQADQQQPAAEPP